MNVSNTKMAKNQPNRNDSKFLKDGHPSQILYHYHIRFEDIWPDDFCDLMSYITYTWLLTIMKMCIFSNTTMAKNQPE